MGKRNCAQETILQTERTAFADQLSYAMHTASTQPQRAYEAESIDKEKEDVALQEPLHEDTIPVVRSNVQETPSPDAMQYKAYLFGGTKKAVTKFAERLEKKGINVHVVQRTGRTAQGKMIHWYQAVTAVYADKTELVTIIDMVKKFEKIKDAQIVSMNSSMHAEKKGNS